MSRMLRSTLALGAALGASAIVLTASPRDAHAIASSCRQDGWTTPAGATLPRHPHLVYFTDARAPMSKQPWTLVATIDGTAVPVKLTFAAAGPYELAQIEIASERTGALQLTWKPPAAADAPVRVREPSRSFVIDKAVVLAAQATGTPSRYHRAFRHSTVHESEDGLAVEVDVPAVAFALRWRRDDQTAWQDLALPATPGTPQVARIGELGCVANFSVAMLEHGIDLALTAQLANGASVKVALPAHYTLAKLPPGTPVSQP